VTVDADLQRLTDAVHTVMDFPESGIAFKDLSPILSDPELFDLARRQLAATAHPLVDGRHVDAFAGIDSRGFLFASAMASVEHKGVLLVRKDGKLPPPTISQRASTEYSDVALCLNPELFEGRGVVLVDDILATGGTALAAAELIERARARLLGAVFFGEIAALGGRAIVEEGIRAPVAAVLTL
jgi:adenine phosphoribosyltransferase